MTKIVEERNSKTNFAKPGMATESNRPSVVAMDEITKAIVSSLRKDLRDAVAMDLRILRKHGLVP